MDASQEKALDELARRFSVECGTEKKKKLSIYLELLGRWGRRVNLTADPRPDVVLNKHLPDGFALARLCQGPKALVNGGQMLRALDVGSGGGLPAVVFGVLCPRFSLTLCEPRQKRCAFLRTVIAELDLEWTLFGGRLDSLTSGSFDLCLSLATWSPEQWLERSADFVSAGGHTAVFLASPDSALPKSGWFGEPEVLDYRVDTDVVRRCLLYLRQ